MPLKTVCIEKTVGETPLMALTRLRGLRPELQTASLAYAGRLDPMASGKLLVLVGEECKRQKQYHGLDKEYIVEIVFGFKSDTGDVLGITKAHALSQNVQEVDAIRRAIRLEEGSHVRPYPSYSSKTVDGVPLFYRSLEGTLPAKLPTHTEHFHRIRVMGMHVLSRDEFEKRVFSKLALTPISTEPSKALGADFRIQEVRASWEEALKSGPDSVTVITLRVTASSGAYMRSLAERIGKALGTEALALSIHRTKIGRYLPFLGLWVKRFC